MADSVSHARIMKALWADPRMEQARQDLGFCGGGSAIAVKKIHAWLQSQEEFREKTVGIAKDLAVAAQMDDDGDEQIQEALGRVYQIASTLAAGFFAMGMING